MFKLEDFGKDHWSLLAFFETQVVDYPGKHVDLRRMRVNEFKRGFSNGCVIRLSGNKYEYGTIFKDNQKLDPGHDDIDVMNELEAEGFCKNTFTDMNPVIQLTELGWGTCNKIRQHKGKGGYFSNFKYQGAK